MTHIPSATPQTHQMDRDDELDESEDLFGTGEDMDETFDCYAHDTQKELDAASMHVNVGNLDPSAWSVSETPYSHKSVPKRCPDASRCADNDQFDDFMSDYLREHSEFPRAENYMIEQFRIVRELLRFFRNLKRKLAKKNWQNFQIFWIWSGAKECRSCRSRKMLKNEPTLAIVAAHTDENEPIKVKVRSPERLRLLIWHPVVRFFQIAPGREFH